MNRSNIQNIYDESKLVFTSDVEKQLIDLEKFYQDLTFNRAKRLQFQKHKTISELNNLNIEFNNLKKEFDSLMKFLNAHQALEVFTKTSSYLAELQQNREKLKGYEKLQHDYEQKKTALKKQMILQSEETVTYLDQAKNEINNILERFRVLVKHFYPDALAGITVRNNDRKKSNTI